MYVYCLAFLVSPLSAIPSLLFALLCPACRTFGCCFPFLFSIQSDNIIDQPDCWHELPYI